LHLFGRGIAYFNDKWTVTAPYKYHVAIENGQFEDYWTEKLSDAFLADCYPFYIGCPNIFDYFPQASLTVLDISDFEGAAAAVEAGIASGLYESSATARRQAKDLVLNTYNLFPTLSNLIERQTNRAMPERLILVPNASFHGSLVGRGQRLIRRLERVISRR